MKISIPAGLLCLLMPAILSAQQNNPAVRQIYSFKNGQSFFIREGSVNTPGGHWRYEGEIPMATNGSLWFGSSSGQIKRISGSTDTIEKKEKAVQLLDLLDGNKGAKVKLRMIESGNAAREIEGSIESVLRDDNSVNSASVLIKTAAGYTAVNTWDIKSAEFISSPSLQYGSKEPRQTLNVYFRDENKASQQLKMMYLSNSVAWQPVYLIDLISDKKAAITMNAELRNNGEKFSTEGMNFVVGVPSFAHSGSPDWLVEPIGNYPLYDFAPKEDSYIDNSIIRSKAIGAIADDVIGAQSEPTGSTNEDFYIYRVKDVTVPAKSSASIELQRGELDVEHVYSSALQSNTAADWVYSNNYSFNNSKKHVVFHSLKFKNTLSAPLTGGPAFVTNNSGGELKPLAQGTIEYTPAKAETTLLLTESPDIRIEHSESEEKRKENARSTKNTSYDLVTVTASFKAKNYSSKDVKMNVSRRIQGELLNTSGKWEIKKGVATDGSFNPINDVKWEFSLKAGEESTVTYSYQIYLRNN